MNLPIILKTKNSADGSFKIYKKSSNSKIYLKFTTKNKIETKIKLTLNLFKNSEESDNTIFYDIVSGKLLSTDSDAEWDGCMTYFLEMLCCFIIRCELDPNRVILDKEQFFLKLKYSKTLEILEEGSLIKYKNEHNKTKTLKLFSGGMEAGAMLEDINGYNTNEDEDEDNSNVDNSNEANEKEDEDNSNVNNGNNANGNDDLEDIIKNVFSKIFKTN